MRVLVLSQYYPPENAMIPATLARSLAAKGHQVKVLTGHPNYPEGRLFDGYRQQWRATEWDGPVEVLRVPLWIDHSQSAARRTLNYASFGLSAATAYNFAKDADVIYVYATQMTPAFAPWVWRLFGGAPYVLHVQDLWPDSITGSSMVTRRSAAVVEGALAPWLGSVYRNAHAVIGIAPTMVQTLVERGVQSHKAHLIYNWAHEGPAATAHRPSPPRDGATRILYGGNVGDMQDLETAVRAAHQAHDAGVRLTIVGDGVALPRVRAVADELGCTNVTFEGRVPPDRIGQHYAASDFALVSLKDLPMFRGTIPSKFQASLAHGKPVITSVQGDLRRFVDHLRVGFTADAENHHSLERAFRRAARLHEHERRAMAERARVAYEDWFSLRAGTEAVERVLQQAVRPACTPTNEQDMTGDARAVS